MAGRKDTAVNPTDHQKAVWYAWASEERHAPAPSFNCWPITIAKMAAPNAPPIVWKMRVEILACGICSFRNPLFEETIIGIKIPYNAAPNTSCASPSRKWFVSTPEKANGMLATNVTAKLQSTNRAAEADSNARYIRCMQPAGQVRLPEEQVLWMVKKSRQSGNMLVPLWTNRTESTTAEIALVVQAVEYVYTARKMRKELPPSAPLLQLVLVRVSYFLTLLPTGILCAKRNTLWGSYFRFTRFNLAKLTP